MPEIDENINGQINDVFITKQCEQNNMNSIKSNFLYDSEKSFGS